MIDHFQLSLLSFSSHTMRCTICHLISCHTRNLPSTRTEIIYDYSDYLRRLSIKLVLLILFDRNSPVICSTHERIFIVFSIFLPTLCNINMPHQQCIHHFPLQISRSVFPSLTYPPNSDTYFWQCHRHDNHPTTPPTKLPTDISTEYHSHSISLYHFYDNVPNLHIATSPTQRLSLLSYASKGINSLLFLQFLRNGLMILSSLTTLYRAPFNSFAIEDTIMPKIIFSLRVQHWIVTLFSHLLISVIE